MSEWPKVIPVCDFACQADADGNCPCDTGDGGLSVVPASLARELYEALQIQVVPEPGRAMKQGMDALDRYEREVGP